MKLEADLSGNGPQHEDPMNARFTRISVFALLVASGFWGPPAALASELRNAVKANELDRVKALIRSGANVNEKSYDGGPLTIAARQGNLEITSALIEAGADVEALDGAGRTAIIGAACSSRGLGTLKILLAAGANPLANDEASHMNALHWAASCGETAAVEALLAAGLDVNLKDGGYQETALHHAAAHADLDMVRLLVAHGADINIADKGGNTPTAIARGTAKDLLESLGGK